MFKELNGRASNKRMMQISSFKINNTEILCCCRTANIGELPVAPVTSNSRLDTNICHLNV